jgi:hypothetical protein
LLYVFPGGLSGHEPSAGVIFDEKGNLYGTTLYGGTNGSCTGYLGCGVFFEISPPTTPGAQWTETVLYNARGAYGVEPAAPLIFDDSGNLYGTTQYNAGTGHFGSVIELTPRTVILVNPTSLNFGTQPVNTTSLPVTVTLTNKGHQAVSMENFGIVGSAASNFAQTNSCGTSLASGASCFIYVTFTPNETGYRKATLEIKDTGGGSPQAISLEGYGT